MLQTNYLRAEVCHREAWELFAELGDVRGQANALQGLAQIDFYEQRYEQAQALYTQSLDLHRQVGNERGIASVYHHLGNLQMRLDNPEQARYYLEQSIAHWRQQGERLSAAQTLGALAQLDYTQDRLDDALAGCCEILPIFQEMGIVWAATLCISHIAMIAQKQQQYCRAVTLFGAVQSLRETSNFALPPVERAGHEATMRELRTLLGDADFMAAQQAGRLQSLDDAVRYALRS